MKYCEICEATLAGDDPEHYSRHLREARRIIEGVERLDLNPNRATTARAWVKICNKKLRSNGLGNSP